MLQYQVKGAPPARRQLALNSASKCLRNSGNSPPGIAADGSDIGNHLREVAASQDDDLAMSVVRRRYITGDVDEVGTTLCGTKVKKVVTRFIVLPTRFDAKGWFAQTRGFGKKSALVSRRLC